MTCDPAVSERSESGAGPLPLADVVRDALAQTRRSWLQRVVVTAEGGTVVLQGQVPSYYLKQMAQAIALALPGVERVRNELRVEGGDR